MEAPTSEQHSTTPFSSVAFIDKDILGQGSFDNKDEADLLLVHELSHYAMIPKAEALQHLLTEKVGIRDAANLQELFQTPGRRVRSLQRALQNGTINWKEFYAKGSEFYFQGQEKFKDTYEPYLGGASTQALYDVLKDEVFEGREY